MFLHIYLYLRFGIKGERKPFVLGMLYNIFYSNYSN